VPKHCWASLIPSAITASIVLSMVRENRSVKASLGDHTYDYCTDRLLLMCMEPAGAQSASSKVSAVQPREPFCHLVWSILFPTPGYACSIHMRYTSRCSAIPDERK
jgi:hypothetical protein